MVKWTNWRNGQLKLAAAAISIAATRTGVYWTLVDFWFEGLFSYTVISKTTTLQQNFFMWTIAMWMFFDEIVVSALTEIISSMHDHTWNKNKIKKDGRLREKNQ